MEFINPNSSKDYEKKAIEMVDSLARKAESYEISNCPTEDSQLEFNAYLVRELLYILVSVNYKGCNKNEVSMNHTIDIMSNCFKEFTYALHEQVMEKDQ